MWDLFHYYIDMSQRINTVLQWVAISVCIVIIFSKTEPKLSSVLRNLCKAAVIYAALTLLETVLFFFLNLIRIESGPLLVAVNEIKTLITYAVVLIVYARFFCQDSPKAKVIKVTVFYAIASVFDTIATATNFILSQSQPSEGILAASVVIDLILIAVSMFLKRYDINQFRHIFTSGLIMIISICAVTVIARIVCSVAFFSENTAFLLLLSFVCLLSVNIIAYIMFYDMTMTYNENLLLAHENQQAKDSANMLRLSEKNRDDLNMLRHDMKNHFAYMQMLIAGGRFEELSSYFQKINRDLATPLAFVECPNDALKSIVNLEISKAQTAGVEVEALIHVPPELSVEDKDLCSVLTNLIDNAIEACVRFDMPEKRIKIQLDTENSFLLICVVNPLPEEEAKRFMSILSRGGELFETVKEDKSQHGYGTKIIEKIVARYNGEIKYSVEGQNLIATAILMGE